MLDSVACDAGDARDATGTAASGVADTTGVATTAARCIARKTEEPRKASCCVLASACKSKNRTRVVTDLRVSADTGTGGVVVA